MAMTEGTGTPDLRPLGVGEILDISIKLYLRNAATLIGLIALVMIPIGILIALFMISLIPDSSFVEDGTLYFTTESNLNEFLTITGVSGLLEFLGALVAVGAAFKAVTDAYLGRRADISSSLAFAGKRIPSLLWVAILAVLAVGVGLIALIIPGIYLAVAFSVAVPALLVEDFRGSKALGRSRDLVKGRWWPVFGTLILGYFLIPAIIQFIIGLIMEAALLGGVDSVSSWVFISQIGNTIAGILSTPIQVAVITVLYFDLRVRKEGFDLQLLTERLSGGATGLPPGTATPQTGPGSPPSGV